MSRFLSISSVMIVLSTASAVADTIDLPAVNDAGMWESDPGYCYGSEGCIWVGFYSGYSGDSLIEFDLSPYIGATVNTATLKLYAYYNYGAIPDDNWLYLVDDSWDEGTVTWGNNPGYNSDIALNFGASITGAWSELDVAAFVQAWLDETYDNYGFYITQTGTADGSTHFYGKDKPGTTYDPILSIDYDPNSVKSTSLGEIKAVYK